MTECELDAYSIAYGESGGNETKVDGRVGSKVTVACDRFSMHALQMFGVMHGFFPTKQEWQDPLTQTMGKKQASQIPGNHDSQGPSIRSQPPNLSR
jgi:hypothetical protein